MDFTHLHLLMNHIPVLGVPLALLFLVYSVRTRNLPAQRFALLVLAGLAAMAVPVYLTGEPAEKGVEHLPGFSESFLEPHEDAALVAVILTALTGAVALLAFLLKKNEKLSQLVTRLAMGLAILATLSLLYTANKGGQVRHTELRSTTGAPASSESD